MSTTVKRIVMREVQSLMTLKARRGQVTVTADDLRSFEQMPGPPQWPLVGSLPSFLIHPDLQPRRLHLMADALFGEYGDIFRMKFPTQAHVVNISHPDDIEQLHRMTSDLPERETFLCYKHLRSNHQYFEKGQTGIFTESGEEWARVRKRVQPHTSRVKNVMSYLPQMDQVAKDFVDKCATMRDEKNEVPEYFTKEVFKWALESLGLIIFNKRLGCFQEAKEALKVISLADDLIEKIHQLQLRSLFRPWWWYETPNFRKLRIAHDEMLSYVKEVVKDSQVRLQLRGPDSKDDLNILEKLILDPHLSLKDVHALLIDMLFAGIDTTSISALFTIMRIAENPHKQDKLQEELDHVLGNGETELTPELLKELRYTKACVKEALRLDPPVVCVNRIVPKDFVLRGYVIPKGTIVQYTTRATGRREDVFNNAHHYIPERWLRGASCPIHPCASLPFGAGVRSCVGRRIAEQEIHALLARMFHRFRVEWRYEPLNPKLNLLLTPDKPMKFTLTERR